MGNDLGKLEPPSFGLRRKKRKRTPEPAAESADTESPAEGAADATDTSTRTSAETTEPASPTEPEPTRELPLDETGAAEPTEQIEAVEPVAAAEETPDPDAPVEPEPEPAPVPEDETEDDEGRREARAKRPSLRERLAARPQRTREEEPVGLAPALEPTARTEEEPDDPATEPGRPLLTGHAAAAVTGCGVGLFLVLGIALVETLSQAARGTSSLGRAGIPLLVVLVGVGVLLGAWALRRFDVPSPGSVSFLGTGLVVVIAVFFFTSAIATLGGGIAIVVLATLSFVLSRWVTVTYIEPAEVD